MNLTVRLTLDGMIRALRRAAHEVAEDGERAYLDRRSRLGTRREIQLQSVRLGEEGNDRGGE
ncbi:hypothetical protein [Arvimicrobium flavum]|uniref:hypothetical protein n=1 Tax=Arvimicrobium flavum TaxID=3393320 RepID=UPI00237A5D39|nr:hypothetical protein [Mesorhizobium shangrilense]